MQDQLEIVVLPALRRVMQCLGQPVRTGNQVGRRLGSILQDSHYLRKHRLRVEGEYARADRVVFVAPAVGPRVWQRPLRPRAIIWRHWPTPFDAVEEPLLLSEFA